MPVDRADGSAPALTADLADRPSLAGPVLDRLAAVIASRLPAAGGNPDTSYVARLFSKGTDAVLKKVGEEATEAVMAGKDGDPAKIVYEFADLWFHSLIALAHFGLRPEDVLAELARREGMSGLEEFARRKTSVPQTAQTAHTAPAPQAHPAEEAR